MTSNLSKKKNTIFTKLDFSNPHYFRDIHVFVGMSKPVRCFVNVALLILLKTNKASFLEKLSLKT